MPRTRTPIVVAVCAAALVGGWMAGRDIGPSLAPTVATGTSTPRTGSVAHRGPRARAATDESSTESEEKSSAPAKPPGRFLVHVVTWEDGSPIAGARLVLLYVDGEAPTATTDANGDARLDVPITAKTPDDPDTWIEVTAPGRVRDAVHGEVAPGAEHRETLRMRPGFAVDGLVHDAAGRPVAGAHVSATDESGCITPYPQIAEADGSAEGRFRIDGLPLTSHVGFEITAAGHVLLKLGRRPHDTKPLDVVLEAGGVIRGVIRTPDGTRAGDARVVASCVVADGDRFVEDVETRTGDDGGFVLDTLDPGRRWTLVAHDSDFMDSEESAEVTPGAEAKCDLRLRPAAHVVIDLDFAIPHAPSIAHVTLPSEPDRDCPVPGRTTTVVRTPGKFHIDADVPGLRWVRATGVAEAGATTTLTMRFDEGASITGVVVDDLGATVGGLVVRIDAPPRVRRETTSARDGTFVLKGLDDANYSVIAGPPGRFAAAAKFSAPGDGLRLVVPRNGEVVARLRIPDGATQPATRKVHWNGYPAASEDDDAPWTDGKLVRSLPPANYIVEIEVDGYVKWETRDVAVVAGGRTDLGEIVLDPGVPLSGHVADLEGRGVATIDVFVDDELLRTDAKGDFRFPHLAVGAHEVRVTLSPDFLEAVVPVTLAKDTAPLVVTVHRGALLHVRVTGASPEDAEGINVQAFPADAPVGEEAGSGAWLEGSAADGYVYRLPAGPMRIEVRKEDQVIRATKHVVLQEGEDVEIEIAIPK